MSNKISRLENKRFGRLVVSHDSGKRDVKGSVIWVCVCDCGETTEVRSKHLKGGQTRSCGCLSKKQGGLSSIPEYKRLYSVWGGMINRCKSPKHRYWSDYGGRGIRVSSSWLRFEVFLKDMLPSYKEGLEIDRIDNDGDYCKENCKWSTHKEQIRNRRNTRRITIDGIIVDAIDVARNIGLTPSSFYKRLDKWGLERAISEPRNSVKVTK